MSIEELEANDPNLIQGVRIIYMKPGTPARDVTAFRHALKTGYRLRKHGQRLSDNPIIDAYLHAYDVAVEADKTARLHEYPSLRDLKTMARRVRAYVTKNNRSALAGGTSGGSSYNYTTPAEKTVLTTFGSRGGAATAAARAADPEREDARKVREGWQRANQRRVQGTRATGARILEYVSQQLVETGTMPTRKEIAAETGVSIPTIDRNLAKFREAGLLD